jgi:hypothetical protein
MSSNVLSDIKIRGEAEYLIPGLKISVGHGHCPTHSSSNCPT